MLRDIFETHCVRVYHNKKEIAAYKNYKKAADYLDVAAMTVADCCSRRGRLYSHSLKAEVACRLSKKKPEDKYLNRQPIL